ncbi:hypothetical protein BLNAU_7256 [Blattamonas nauphoetae]|uniref:Uncharacterized protein n=1 Tax=Blattamonas nauphoetae TaxID=2049346 RepID=A0ABQ9Y250_9EUKA|nr:hypothetical protein BLNAU_7256 [Blattamonas nauphoetae]
MIIYVFIQHMTTWANLSMVQPNIHLFECTEVLIAPHEVYSREMSKHLFSPSTPVTFDLYGSDGSPEWLEEEGGEERGCRAITTKNDAVNVFLR